ncbi:hypothetical protein [Staphylococcus aureus]
MERNTVKLIWWITTKLIKAEKYDLYRRKRNRIRFRYDVML